MRESAGSPPSGCWCQPCAIRTSISSERVFRLFSFINCRVGGCSGWGWKSRKATKQRALLSRVARCAWQEFPDVYRCFAMLIGKSDFKEFIERRSEKIPLRLRVTRPRILASPTPTANNLVTLHLTCCPWKFIYAFFPVYPAVNGKARGKLVENSSLPVREQVRDRQRGHIPRINED